MTNAVTRNDIKSQLEAWQKGTLSEARLQAWAAERFLSADWTVEDHMADEILGRLDALGMSLITKDDVPALIEFLDSPGIAEVRAKNKLAEYQRSVDVKLRKQTLSAHPFYAPFCK